MTVHKGTEGYIIILYIIFARNHSLDITGFPSVRMVGGFNCVDSYTPGN